MTEENGMRTARLHVSFVPPWEFWPRTWFGYWRPKRITASFRDHHIYRWFWWNFSWGNQ